CYGTALAEAGKKACRKGPVAGGGRVDGEDDPMTAKKSRFGLDRQGMHHLGAVYWNQSVPVLYEHAVRRSEGELAAGGSFSVSTGFFTGRTPRDKYIVE